MKLLLVIYGGPRPGLVPALLEEHCAGGWTELPGAHGAGRSGRHTGSRAWPGESTVYFTIVDDGVGEELTQTLKGAGGSAAPGERLHVAELPVERFF
jgi:hypothetical protein